MVLKLELENGEIKEYSTHRSYYSSEPEIKPTHYTKCGLKFEGDIPKTGTCDHLDCALHAPIRETRDFVIMGIIFGGILFCIAFWEKRNILKSIYESMWILVFWGLLSVPLSIVNLRRWLELNEFKKHGTIHGKRAYKVYN